MKVSTVVLIKYAAIALWALGMVVFFFGELTELDSLAKVGIRILMSAVPVTGVYLVAGFFISSDAQKEPIDDSEGLSFSQVDSTEGFGDNLEMESTEWIKTNPINEAMDNPETMGLPAVGSTEDEVYRIASNLSLVRESISISDDGVYCPICNHANVDIEKLRMPCPTCGRELLAFGWD
ncbi:MAG: hypothetical protein O7F13_01570 [Gammaproteobacteria bacterium]|nr:hypothetical protein [Gammaproteobacteria bacterium]